MKSLRLFLIVSSVIACLVATLVPVIVFFVLGNIIITAAAAVGAGLVIGGISGFVSGNFIVKPIDDICEQAKLLAKNQPIEVIETTRKDELGKLTKLINSLSDRDKAIREANQDALTGLANRRYLLQRLEGALARDESVATFFIDLDGFKPINDTYGHEAGDEALLMVADRLKACVREHDILCRLGGDEFVICLIGLADREVMKTRADKVLELLNTPFWIGDNRIKMGGSIGISVAPDDAKEAEPLLNAADEAMYAAKQGGKNAYRFYS